MNSFIFYTFKFFRLITVALCFSVVLTAGIMFIWLSVLPPANAPLVINEAITDGQYVYAIFGESAKYAFLLVMTYFITDHYIKKTQVKHSSSAVVNATKS
ncbi:hypothetical protein [Pseudoalteromonas sp. SK20]|uniref:hypothetical protein n=1 Tax=Pseudoalteromonas sp. SK20 TaxID=1938367 RepID=UPI0009753BBB|nr:hypothetical protein [Pseudoalteromonas sp. SK20]